MATLTRAPPNISMRGHLLLPFRNFGLSIPRDASWMLRYSRASGSLGICFNQFHPCSFKPLRSLDGTICCQHCGTKKTPRKGAYL